MPLLAAAADMPVGSTGLQKDVVFTDYSPLSRSMELARRLLSPLNAMRVSQEVERSGQAAREQSIDLAHEKFAVYVPAHAPPHGYALLVFVPPWQEATVPQRWCWKQKKARGRPAIAVYCSRVFIPTGSIILS